MLHRPQQAPSGPLRYRHGSGCGRLLRVACQGLLSYHRALLVRRRLPQDQTVALAVIRPKSGPTQAIRNPYAAYSGGNYWEPEVGFVSETVDVVRHVGRVKAQGQIQIEHHYTAVLRQGSQSWQQPVAPRFTAAQTNIESDHPAIVAAAESVAQGPSFDNAYSLFRTVASTLSWPQGNRINTVPSALQALTSEVGGCAEFANLATAFYRATKIPAYTVDGLAMPAMLPLSKKSSTWNHPAGAHAWVHFATDGHWAMADPSWAGRLLPRSTSPATMPATWSSARRRLSAPPIRSRSPGGRARGL